jgi:hypothetical protein
MVRTTIQPAKCRKSASPEGLYLDGTRSGIRLGLDPFLLRFSEIPVQQEVLPFGVADDPFPVAAELRIVGWQKKEAGQSPLAELLDEGPVAKVRIDPPVRGDGAEVNDANVTPGRCLLVRLLNRHGLSV